MAAASPVSNFFATISDRRNTVPAGIALGALLVLFLIARFPLVDDAYITLGHARTLATSGTWGMFEGHPTNAAADPLNVALLAGLGRVCGSFPFAARALAVLCCWVVFLCATGLGRRLFASSALGSVALLAIAANPLLLSSIGLSPALVAALISLALWSFASSRWKLLGVVLGLLFLASMETALLALCFVAACRRHKAPWLVVAGAGAVVALPWIVFSWVGLGSAVPDSFFLRTTQQWGDGITFADGLGFYGETYTLAMVASFVLAPFALLTLLGGPVVRRLTAVLVGYAVLSYVAYIVLSPPPYHWYFLQQAIPLALAGALGIGTAAHRYGPRALVFASVPAVLIVGVLARSGIPLDEPFIHANQATEERYAEIGRALESATQPGDTITFDCELGTLAFYSNRFCSDAFSDVDRANAAISSSRYGRPDWFASLLRVNFHFRGAVRDPEPTAWTLKQGPGLGLESAAGGTFWSTSTRWSGEGHLTLTRNPGR